MRIGIDARELGGQPTGLGRYLNGLFGAWGVLPEAQRHHFTIFSPSKIDMPRGMPGETVVVPGAGDIWWEQLDLARTANRRPLDVFFAPGYTAPLRVRAPVVLTVHDVSFTAHPEWFGWREGARRRTMTRLSAEKAHTVLTVSDFSRSEIVRHLGVPPERVLRIHLGLTPPAGPVSRAAAPEPAELVLFVGSVLNRRHVPDLIRAFAVVAARHPRACLAIVGDNRTYPPQDLEAVVQALGIASRVEIHDYVDDAMLGDLYRRAHAFAFLSEYEGFGLTPLEALAAGVPPLLLDTPTAREICGGAAALVSTTETSAVAAALERLLFDEETRHEMLERAPAVLSRFTWERAGRETLEAIVHAADRPS